jgi:hypothetical protein
MEDTNSRHLREGSTMGKTMLAAAAAAMLAAGTAAAGEGPVPPATFGHLDHAIVIIMENRTDAEILGNPNAPFINNLARTANRATNDQLFRRRPSEPAQLSGPDRRVEFWLQEQRVAEVGQHGLYRQWRGQPLRRRDAADRNPG